MKYSVSHEKHVITFSPSAVRARVLMIPFATSAELVQTVLELGENQHHAWGVKELLAASIEVSVSRGYGKRWELLGQDWRIPDTRAYDLIYSNHNRLIRTPIENFLGLRKTPFVSLVYAGERLFAASRHFGVICMTPHAFERFDALQRPRTFYAPWGIDPESALHQRLNPSGEFHISTGVTGRDFDTLFRASRLVDQPVVLAARGHSFRDTPPRVRIVDSVISPWGIRELYANACAGLIVLKPDKHKRQAVGWTNMLELMAVGLPIIKTRTGSLDDIVNLESIGAGILVEPEDPVALSSAMVRLQENRELQLSMGRAGAEYVRAHLTMQHFAEPLIHLVDSAAER